MATAAKPRAIHRFSSYNVAMPREPRFEVRVARLLSRIGGLSLAIALLAPTLSKAQDHIQNVIYLKQSGSAFTLDVFKPKNPNRKAIVWIDSFGWNSFDDFDLPFAKEFTDRGFTLFAVHHGSQPNYTIPEIIPMITRAVRFVRAGAAGYGIDPNAIGVCGASSGGHLALEVGGLGDNGFPKARDPVDKVSGRANAVVAFFAPTDFENWGANGTPVLESHNGVRFGSAFGFAARSHKEMMQEIAHDTSPINLVKAGFPPTLLIHGEDDKIVPLQQSKKIDSAFEAAKVIHKLTVLKGLGYSDDTIEKGLPEALAWFDRYLVVRKALE
jgi:acetyl esterase/lipase